MTASLTHCIEAEQALVRFRPRQAFPEWAAANVDGARAMADVAKGAAAKVFEIAARFEAITKYAERPPCYVKERRKDVILTDPQTMREMVTGLGLNFTTNWDGGPDGYDQYFEWQKTTQEMKH